MHVVPASQRLHGSAFRHIRSFLAAADRQAMGVVCKRWRAACVAVACALRLNAKPALKAIEAVESRLAGRPVVALETEGLLRSSAASARLLRAVARLPLTHLHLPWAALAKPSVGALCGALKARSGQLLSLCLTGNRFEGPALQRVLDTIATCSRLMSLDLAWTGLGVTHTQRSVVPLMKALPLRRLNLSASRVGTAAADVCTALPHAAALQVLYLHDNGDVSGSLQALAAVRDKLVDRPPLTVSFRGCNAHDPAALDALERSGITIGPPPHAVDGPAGAGVGGAGAGAGAGAEATPGSDVPAPPFTGIDVDAGVAAVDAWLVALTLNPRRRAHAVATTPGSPAAVRVDI